MKTLSKYLQAQSLGLLAIVGFAAEDRKGIDYEALDLPLHAWIFVCFLKR